MFEIKKISVFENQEKQRRWYDIWEYNSVNPCRKVGEGTDKMSEYCLAYRQGTTGIHTIAA